MEEPDLEPGGRSRGVFNIYDKKESLGCNTGKPFPPKYFSLRQALQKWTVLCPRRTEREFAL